MKMKKLPIAVAVAAAFSLAATAQADGHREHGSDSDVEINKEIDVDQDYSFQSDVRALGLILIDSQSTAVSEVNQASRGNHVTNGSEASNDANVGDDVLKGATGNIGLNVAAGDNNVQQNSTSLATSASQGNEITVGMDIDVGEIAKSSNSYSSSEKVHHQADYAVGQRSSSSESSSASSKANSNESSEGGWNVNGGAYYHEGAGNGSSNYAGSSSSNKVVVDATSKVKTDDNAGNTSNTVTDTDSTAKSNTESHSLNYDYQDYAVGGGISGGANESHGSSSSSNSKSSESSEASRFAKFNASGEDSYDASQKSSYSDSYEGSYSVNARIDATLVFGGAADAETFSNQAAAGNVTDSYGASNSATLGDNVAKDATGNIGINIAAGGSNVQANQLSIASASGALATATASSNQGVYGNTTNNAAMASDEVETLNAEITLSGSATGSYEGTSDQVGDVYLDTWDEQGHPGGNNTGHVDVDSEAQGAQDPNGDGGAFLFSEAGEVALDNISLTGTVSIAQSVYNAHSNTASLGGSALSGASGNVGVNIAAGTNNLQGNALAIARVSAPVAPPAGGGNGGE